MRIVKWVLAVLLILAILFVVIGMILPREVTVARSITINAPPEDVFPHVNSMKATEAWSPWLSRDPATKLVYSGPDAGTGARLEWASDNPQVGVGSQVITASTENERVETALDFGDMGTANAAFLLVDAGGATEVTWTLETDMGGNPVGRWMGLMMDRWVGADYERGLANLKALVEG
ncbi:SRPBCC family protein [Pseudaestuariivita atlantica]|uniref:Polyketide cyclase n=1 Tax=Pseudaestuariivita atlantica TaxID=1317121 RepID=A0A0L1JMS6_9RHOB|nr:SRPBCC family protein [Pseudaestuariivita atlantica]KNG92718.1 hypothetical protein ATO11_16630 [Pseudaestuariivita atlantica]